MKKILNVSLDDFVKLVDAGMPANNTQPAMNFVHSTIGRIFIQELPNHKCEFNCDTLSLIFAEELAAKRKVNPKALELLLTRFLYGVRQCKDASPVATEIEQRGISPREFFIAWLNEFYDATIDVLHGELAPDELFGEEGYLRDTWRAFMSGVE